MRHRMRSLATFANVVSAVALFVALGGTGYAMTGGNFILGKNNSANASTRLSSGVAGDALAVTSTTASGGRAIGGFSNAGQGVYGHSNANAGVVGESANFDGVFGVSNNVNSSAVSAHNNAFGFGLWAQGGHAGFKTAAIHGESARGNAVEGISGRDIASGVYGQNDSTGDGVAGRSANGTGVLGDSQNGWAVQAAGNATQSRAQGGFVKAMAFVNTGSDHPIQRCFNSQVPPGQATSGNCGIGLSRSPLGDYDIDFGFDVRDRVVSVTQANYNTSSELNRVLNADPVHPPNNPNIMEVSAVNAETGKFDSSSFFIVVF
jgi:hypothetical protein